MINHPLPIGTKVLSVAGEMDQGGEDDYEVDKYRETGPNAVGEVISADYYPHQGWCYGIQFSPSGVWVFVDQLDSIDDESKYRVVSLPDQERG